MRTRILIAALGFWLFVIICGVAGSAVAQAPSPSSNAGPVQPWGLPPLPPGIGPVEKFADIKDTPQGKFLEGGSLAGRDNGFATTSETA